jgi:hypothetical protein
MCLDVRYGREPVGVKSTLFAEDPKSPDSEDLRNVLGLKSAVIAARAPPKRATHFKLRNLTAQKLLLVLNELFGIRTDV